MPLLEGFHCHAAHCLPNGFRQKTVNLQQSPVVFRGRMPPGNGSKRILALICSLAALSMHCNSSTRMQNVQAKIKNHPTLLPELSNSSSLGLVHWESTSCPFPLVHMALHPFSHELQALWGCAQRERKATRHRFLRSLMGGVGWRQKGTDYESLRRHHWKRYQLALCGRATTEAHVTHFCLNTTTYNSSILL